MQSAREDSGRLVIQARVLGQVVGQWLKVPLRQKAREVDDELECALITWYAFMQQPAAVPSSAADTPHAIHKTEFE